jgi:hypothetical protein
MLDKKVLILFAIVSLFFVSSSECLQPSAIEDSIEERDNSSTDEEDLFSPVDDGLPEPDFTPPSCLTILMKEYGILALDCGFLVAHKCTEFKHWLGAYCAKISLVFKRCII